MNTSEFTFIDLILGAQKTSDVGKQKKFQTFTPELVEQLQRYLNEQNGNLFISGEYIASDAYTQDECDSTLLSFIENDLHFTWANTSHTGSEITPKINLDINLKNPFHYFSDPNRVCYHVANPDVIEPVNGSEIVTWYANSTEASSIVYSNKKNRIYISTIPFETIMGSKRRNELMSAITDFFYKAKEQGLKKITITPKKSKYNPNSYISTQKSYK